MWEHTSPIPGVYVIGTMSMPTKKKPAGRKTRKIQVSLPETLVRALDKEVRRSGRQTSRATLMKEMIGLGVVRRMASEADDPASRADAMRSLLKEAGPLVAEAVRHEEAGDRAMASRLYLAAAAREIEAISYMPSGDESGIKSALIMAVLHMKKGTGYRRLPEVQVSTPSPTSVQ